ncbi:MAG: thiamine diphosphokinase [Eubacterium sp.]|nr:thiamine diphosphokinase [Eubacterium sp.]
MHIYIITGGRVENDFALSYMKKQQPDCIIAADSGLTACYQMEITPDHIFGDFDSVEPTVLDDYKTRVPERIKQFPTRKDETDTELALREAIEIVKRSDEAFCGKHNNQCNDHIITILGGTGTRLDHILGNIQLLKLALDHGVACHIVDAHNRIRMLNNTFSIQKDEQFGKYVSFLPFTERVEGITLKGFEYDVEDWTMESGIARGVSNEIKEKIAEVSIKKGILLMIESRDTAQDTKMADRPTSNV